MNYLTYLINTLTWLTLQSGYQVVSPMQHGDYRRGESRLEIISGVENYWEEVCYGIDPYLDPKFYDWEMFEDGDMICRNIL